MYEYNLSLIPSAKGKRKEKKLRKGGREGYSCTKLNPGSVKPNGCFLLPKRLFPSTKRWFPIQC